MEHKIFVMPILWALTVIFVCTPCHAGAPTEKVRSILDEVMTVQTDPKLKDSRDKRKLAIKKVIASNFDFNAMARESLGSTWNRLSGAQRAEFKNVFRDLFQDSYTRLVLDFLKREKVLYTNEEMKKGGAFVQTTIQRTSDEIPVDYHLASAKKGWLVQDVDIDGVSIVQNYKKSFNRVIKRHSYGMLLQKMRIQQKAIRQSS
jgi:phospholipid transport system substrate-binding protein